MVFVMSTQLGSQNSVILVEHLLLQAAFYKNSNNLSVLSMYEKYICKLNETQYKPACLGVGEEFAGF